MKGFFIWHGMKRRLKTIIYRYPVALTVIWTLVIFILCATPGQYIPSADWLELLSFDKWVHAGIFFVLTALSFTVAVKHRKGKAAILLCCLMCILYGFSLEMMQATLFSNRSADWKDVIANSFGCLLAFLLLKKIRRSAPAATAI